MINLIPFHTTLAAATGHLWAHSLMNENSAKKNQRKRNGLIGIDERWTQWRQCALCLVHFNDNHRSDKCVFVRTKNIVCVCACVCESAYKLAFLNQLLFLNFFSWHFRNRIKSFYHFRSYIRSDVMKNGTHLMIILKTRQKMNVTCIMNCIWTGFLVAFVSHQLTDVRSLYCQLYLWCATRFFTSTEKKHCDFFKWFSFFLARANVFFSFFAVNCCFMTFQHISK